MRNRLFTLRNAALAIFASLLMAGCMPSPYYQRAYSVPGNTWQSSFVPDYKFDISDTSASYRMFFLLRHTNAYPFSNIWLIVSIKQPGDSSFTKVRIEIPLAEPSGKWMGRGMGEIWEQIMPVDYQMNAGGIKGFLKKKGSYELKLEQNMRVNPLPEVLQVGLRVERDRGK